MLALAAEESYKCCQSDLVCKEITECVSQWLHPNQAAYKKVIDKATNSFGVPTSFLILSENVYSILEKLHNSKANDRIPAECFKRN